MSNCGGIDAIPHWAGKSLATPATDAYELSILRDFYDRWEALHSIPNDKAHRKQKELASRKLVDARDSVRLFDKPNG